MVPPGAGLAVQIPLNDEVVVDHLRIVEHLARSSGDRLAGKCRDRLPGGHLSEAGEDRLRPVRRGCG